MRMRRCARGLAATVAVLLVLLAGPAWTQDNPDVLDFSVTGNSEGDFNNNGIIVLNGADFINTLVGGGVNQETSAGGDEATLSCTMYEPDKVGRKADSGKLQQKTQVNLWVVLATVGGTLTGTGLGPSCGCKTQAKDSDGDGFINPGGKLQWKCACKDPAIDVLTNDLGFSATQAAHFISIYGPSLRVSGKRTFL